MTHISKFRWYWFTVAVLVGVTLVYSSYKLTESPPTWFDEGIYTQVAVSLAHRGVQGIQTAPGVFASSGHVTGGYPFLVPMALSLKIFGTSLLAARVPMVVFIVLCVLVAFFLIYKLYDRQYALLSLFLLATFPLLYGNGKNVLGEVPGMLYLFGALYCIANIEAREFKGARWYILAGLLVGLTAATKPVFFLFPLSVGIVFLVFIRRIPLRWKELGLATIAFVAPIILWGYLQFGGGDVAGSILQHYANPYADGSLTSTALENFLQFFKEATPLYCAMLTGLWILSIGIRIYRKERIVLAEWSAFVFSLLILAAYLRTAGWYRYFFEAMMLALIFAPHNLRVIADAIGQSWPRIKLTLYIPAVLLLLGAVQFYQLNFSSWVADHYRSTQTALLENYFSSFSATNVLVYNAPEIVPFLQTKNYYQYFDIEPTGGLAYGKENLDLLKDGVPLRVIVTASNYQQHMDLFESYIKTDSVSSYLILTRQ